MINLADKRIEQEQILKGNIFNSFGKEYTPESISKLEDTLNSNLEKGLIDQELFDKAKEELDLLKGKSENSVFLHKEQVRKNITENTLNKGELSDAFSYNSLSIPKKGSAIKDKLQDLILKKMIQKQQVEGMLNEMLSFVDVLPSEDVYAGYYGDYAQDIAMLTPLVSKIYPYNLCEWREDMKPNISSSVSLINPVDDASYSQNEEKATMCQKFNSYVYSCIDICKEICLARTMLNNLEDNKDYMLDIRQLQSLGF